MRPKNRLARDVPRFTSKILTAFAAATCLSLYTLLLVSAGFTGRAQAVPAFAQQTGQPCSACHVGAFGPQLKPYARDFKLYGYQASDGKNHLPPIAMTIQGSFTRTNAPQEPYAAPHFAANDNFAVDQVSLYYAGKAPLGFGVFAQGTYDGVAENFFMDNTDIRNAHVFDVGGKDLVLGVDFNNTPGVQDPWNSTPAWRFPYNGSGVAPSPTATALVDGTLGGQVFSAGAYGWFNSTLYAEFSEYNPLDPVTAGRLGEGTNSLSDHFTGIIPYWRIALNHDFGTDASAMVGAYGLSADRYPQGQFGAGTDRITDWALDANFLNQAVKNQVYSMHATYIREDQNLRASSVLFGTNRRDYLDTLRADLSWSYKDTWTPTVQLFRTSGNADPAVYSGAAGSPNSDGYVLELAYTGWGKPSSPVWWANWRAALQYTGYGRFNGVAHEASNNNTLYMNLWIALAPFGAAVKR